MIDETTEELASLYVMGELTAEQSARFEADLTTAPELQALVRELYEGFASLALAVPLHTPPPDLKGALLAQFKADHSPAKILRVSFLPWALAAAFAIAATFLFLQQNQLKKQLAELQGRDLLTQMRVATLQSQVQAYASGSAVVLWDERSQKGLVRFQKLPAQPGKDYQLWVLDPQQAQPVDAGIVPVSNDGAASVDFRPDVPVSHGSKFAISIEQKGGVKHPAGQVIFVGE